MHGRATFSTIPALGQLKRVSYIYVYGLPRPVTIAFVFEVTTLGVTVDPETDSLLLMKRFRSGQSVDVSSSHPWARAQGRECLWAWELRNHLGYCDGLQLLFALPPEPDACVQLLAAASQIEVHEVSVLEFPSSASRD